jgi:hypothetical protein
VSRRQASTPKLLVAALALAVLAAAAAAGGSGAARQLSFAPLRATATEVSANWAGYVVTGSGTTYTSVTGTWRQPTVSCGAADAGAASAFWVGLGGYATSSQALEQTGTSADCDETTGRPAYYAWYELVPSPSVKIKNLKIFPGDVITTSVNMLDSSTVLVQVKDRTRGTVFTKKLPFTSPDLTSAEWIAEAPSSCDSSSRCRPIPLSNFGSVDFTKIAALGNGIGGTLTSNPGWTATSINLVADGRRGFFPGPDTFARVTATSAGAVTGDTSADGRGFTVQWSANPSGG